MWEQDDYQFYGQRSDEKVVLVRHQHPLVLFTRAIIDFVILVVIVLVSRYLPSPYNNYLLLIVVVGIAAHAFHYIYAFKNSVCVLSDQRILNVKQKGFFNREINEAELEKIQDVSTNVKGMLQTMFDFGNVTLRTASDTILILKSIGHPYEVQQAIARTLKEIDKQK